LKVLFVDDMSFSMKYYVQALRDNGITVELRSDIDKAVNDFRAQVPWDGAIVDVMFDQPEPAPRYRAIDPEGLRAGLLLTDELRAIQPTLRVIVLTNRPELEAARELSQRPYVHVARKLDTNPIDFVDTVRRFFAPR